MMTSFGSISDLESGINSTSRGGSGARNSFDDDSTRRGSNNHTPDKKNLPSNLVVPPQTSRNTGPCQHCGEKLTRGSGSLSSKHFSPFGTKKRVLRILATIVNLGLIIAVLVLISHLDYDAIPTRDLQSILATWGSRGVRGSPMSIQAKRSADFKSATIEPIPCHSHNDYERQIPLYDALKVGCISIEADIWLQGEDLLIGHTESSLDPSRTLKSLYLDPLTSIIGDRNPDLDLNDGEDHSGSLKGVFTANSTTSLILLVDVKTDSAATLPVLMKQLSPLRKQGLLTHFDGPRKIPGPITVVATGNTDFDTIYNSKDRFVFFDAPLDHHWRKDSAKDAKLYNKDNSYYASVSFEKAIGKPSFRRDFSGEQIQEIKEQVQGAHTRGLKVRYWDTPTWPAGEKIWAQLWKVGVDVLNVDDLKRAKDFLGKSS